MYTYIYIYIFLAHVVLSLDHWAKGRPQSYVRACSLRYVITQYFVSRYIHVYTYVHGNLHVCIYAYVYAY
jgi:hypothetical protein